jgi:hypothetical protein
MFVKGVEQLPFPYRAAAIGAWRGKGHRVQVRAGARPPHVIGTWHRGIDYPPAASKVLKGAAWRGRGVQGACPRTYVIPMAMPMLGRYQDRQPVEELQGARESAVCPSGPGLGSE